MRKCRTLILLLTALASGTLQTKRCEASQSFSQIDLALQATREAYKISTGFEEVVGDSDKNPIVVDLSGDNIGKVFDSIVSQKPKYTWHLEDGVYDLYPKEERDRVTGLGVALYYVKDASSQEASEAVSRLPEFKLWLSEHHATRSEIVSGNRWSTAAQNAKVSIELHNVPLRTVLNHLIAAVGDSGWTVFRWGDNMQLLALYF